MKIEPLADRVVIKPLKEEEKTKGGIILPDTAKEKPQRGTVEAVGAGKLDDKGNRMPMELKKGDKVIYQRYSGSEVKENEEDYLIIREADVIAKLK